MSPLSLLDPIVHVLHQLLLLLVPVLPGTPGVQVALALTLLTFAVRAAMLPLSLRSWHSQQVRLALAPELDGLRRRYRADRSRLVRELEAAHRRAGVGPLSGLGSAVLQLPLLAASYRLVTATWIGTTANIVTTAPLWGAPLSAHWLPVIAGAGIVSAPTAAFCTVLAVLLVLAHRTAAQQGGDGPALLRLLPYGTLVTAAVLPLAVSIYLMSSTLWTVTERAFFARLT